MRLISAQHDSDQVITRLKRMANPRNVAGMARFGINTKRTLGISVNDLRVMAREIGKNHTLAQELWRSGIHEARILAALIDAPDRITNRQLDRWVKDFDSWDICDQVCGLFERTPLGRNKIQLWAKSDHEFVKRAAFAMIAGLAVHDKMASDRLFKQYLVLIRQGAKDERNFVKKAANWALRSIGKRNRALNRQAVAEARKIQKIDSRAARWIAADALRELTSVKVHRRFSSQPKRRSHQ